MTYEQREANVPDYIKSDPLWTVAAYRKSLFMGDLAWPDVTKLVSDRRTISLADQLYRAAGSVGANIAEGYSRGTGKDRVRFYEYALGSARETRDWYYKGRHVPTLAVAEVVEDGGAAPGELKAVYSCGDLYAFDPGAPTKTTPKQMSRASDRAGRPSIRLRLREAGIDVQLVLQAGYCLVVGHAEHGM